LGEGKIAMLISLVIAVLVAVVVYFIALLAMRGLRENELLALPKGALLVKIAKKLDFNL
jgi:stage V sporulation protein B